MKKTHLAGSALALALCAGAHAAPSLNVTVGGIEPGKPIDTKFAFCAPDAKAHTKDGGNISPAISWSPGPKETRSYAIIMHDPDVPTVFDNADKEGKTIAASLPRQEFYHWVLVDIPPDVMHLLEGVESHGITPSGKPPGQTEFGVRGVNDYGKFKGGGVFAGYDGPCPPWNDAKMHHYHFNVYALDIPTLGLSGNITGQQALAAMKGHILAQGEVVGIYSQNPAVMKR